MSQSDFNWTAYAAAVGKKAQADIELADRVQPVLVVGDLSLNTPQHIPPAGYAGTNLVPGVGNRSTFQVSSLDPGGVFVRVQFEAAFGNMRFAGFNPPVTGFTTIPYTTTTSPSGTPLSIVGSLGRVAVFLTQPIWKLRLAGSLEGDVQGQTIFIPRGFSVVWEHTSDAIPVEPQFFVQSVAATQGGDA